MDRLDTRPVITSPALRYHGSKFRLAQWVMQFFPPHQRYTEAFGGAAGVLLQKPRSYAEIYNDLDGEIVNFFRVLRDPDQCAQLLHTLRQLTGAVVLSGYPHALYDDALHDWTRHTTSARISAGRGTGLRTECVWLNPQCAQALSGMTGGLFA